MPAYRFIAVDATGVEQRGVLEADSARGARGLLRARALVPLQVEAISGDSANAGAAGLARRRRRLRAQDLTLLTRQLAGLLVSGLPLERALAAMADDADRPEIRDLLSAIKSEVGSGHALAVALGQHPREFSPIYRALVAAGEDSGDLGRVLSELADYLEQSQALRGRLIQALAYPAIVVLVACGIIVLLLTYVVPQVVGVFQGTHQALPLLTRGLIDLSALLRRWGWALAALAAAGAVVTRAALRRPGPRKAFDAALLRSPLLGRLVRGLDTARFASTLAILTGSGVPILRALQAATETLGNAVLRADAEQALALVREGSSLAAALGLERRFPPVLITFIRLGEQTGTLPSMLERAADQHAQEVQRRAFTLVTILEPLLIVGMGVVVLLIVMAVMLPIIEMNNLVK